MSATAQTSPSENRPPARTVRAVTGVQLMQGIGVRPSRGFWAEAWGQVFKSRTALVALAWIVLVSFFAVYAPVLASGHPLWISVKDAAGGGGGGGGGADQIVGGVKGSGSPLWANLGALDLVLLFWVTGGALWIAIGPSRTRGRRAAGVLLGLVFAIGVLAVAGVVQTRLEANAIDLARELRTQAARTGERPQVVTPFAREPGAGYIVGGAVGTVALVIVGLLPGGWAARRRRIVACLPAAALAVAAIGARWQMPLERFTYESREQAGDIRAWYTLVPWSPFQRFSAMSREEPGSSRWRAAINDATASLPKFGPVTPEQISAVGPAVAAALKEAGPAVQKRAAETIKSMEGGSGHTREDVRRAIDGPIGPKFWWGTDKDGADVLSQVLQACRLSISIGVVSSGIALLIGVVMGAMMGYFGGWVDLTLYRVVEVFMAIPVLFLLIVAVAVLPEELKTTYVIMAIIGAFTWTGIARFTRAEFLKLRNQDFVQAAQAAGLPLRSILFRHMLPNGIAPVLVDTSFSIAAAISIEATLSYLGLGPSDSASWGKLLSSAISSEGEFKWWLAVFPGAAIFLTVLAYNLLGEALRDAIDPKLKKARV